MRIVLEGVDETGKTTFANRLKEEHGFELIHNGPPEVHALIKYAEQVEETGRQYDRSIVFDRLHWGDLVYAPHYRGKTELGWVGFEWLEQALQAQGALTIVTVGDPQMIFERVVAHDDYYVEKDLRHLQMLQGLYMDCLERAKTSPFVSNIDSPEGFIDIDVVLKEAKRRWDLLENIRYLGVDWIGSPVPDVLLVGDIGSDPWRLPFRPTENTSGRRLMDTLLFHSFRFKRYALTNSRMPDAQPAPIRSFWEALRRPPIIALGWNASDVLTEKGLPHARVDHPRLVVNSELEAFGRNIDDAYSEGGVHVLR